MGEDHREPTLRSAKVHQPEGMLMVRLNTTIDGAVRALSEYAAHTGQELADAAQDVISRRSTSTPRRNGRAH